MAGPDDLERAINELYVSPAEAFTQARNALAKRLKAGGETKGAARVRGLRKPVRAAWAVNRFVSQDRAAVEELIAAGGRLRAAQRRAMSTKGTEGLRERSVERARLLSELTRRAAGALGDPPAAVTEEIAATLEAASADEEAAHAVLEARLSKPLPRPAGFGEVLGLKVVPQSDSEEPPPHAGTDRAARERALRGAERRKRQARDRVERLKAEVAALKKRVGESEDQLRAAEAEARGATARLKRLRC